MSRGHRHRWPLPPKAAIDSLTEEDVPPLTSMDSQIRVGFCSDRSIISDLIGYAGLSGWAHMTNIISDLEVIDARVGHTLNPGGQWATRHGSASIPSGVRVRPYSYLSSNQEYVELAIACTLSERAAWIDALDSQVGEPYDIPGIIDFITGRTTDPTYRGTKHPWFCDSLGIWAAQVAGIVPPLLLPSYRRTPGGALDVCMATGRAKIVSWRGDGTRNLLLGAGLLLA